MNFPIILNHSTCHKAFLLVLLLCLWLPAKAMAESCTKTVATAISIQGVVETRSKSNPEWKKVTAQDTFCAGDMVRTRANSRAALYLINDSILRLNTLSTVTFTSLSSQDTSRLDLKKGIAHFISRIKQRFEVVTPYVNAVVDGTEFVVAVNAGQIDVGQIRAGQTLPGQTKVTVLEGQVQARNAQGEISLSQGETALARAGETPALSTRVRPWDAVSWALHYPTVMDITTLIDAPLPEPWNTRVAQSAEHYRQGNLSAALAALESQPDHPVLTDTPADIHRYRATLHLATGQTPLASANLEQALKQNAHDGKALALKAMIAVVQNQTDLALKLARQAIEASPDALAPWLAQSYAQQAIFDLEAARLSVEKAVELVPESALAQARLAELHLMSGQLERALQAAQQATDIAPELARAQSVLGFVHLTRIDIAAAEQAFKQAIQLDQTAPLPRLGLGLAKIRKGQLKDGTREIETAVIVDPTNSLIRSYLGKAYYEQKREKLAEIEFAIAKKLDAKDPTPYFYNAILKQTTNRPVAALKDLQQSITLNDQRAVYRSRLLLDQDRATRGISLSRVYSDLGMEQIALTEGWKSVAIDPSNYSAHRFLANAYSTRPRHEIARVSELLQAQLLQPINITPVKPRLSATYLDPGTGTGLANAGMNEYTPLFERNQAKLFTSAIIGNNGTLSDELTVSGLYNQLSFSLGQFYSETDGFRENNDERNNLYNVFSQFTVTPRLNVQMEYRRRKTKRGDLAFNFDPEEFRTDFRQNIDHDIYRFGGHLVTSSRSRVITNFVYSDRDDNEITPFENYFNNEKGHQIEAQYIFNSPQYNIIAGYGRYNIDVKRDTSGLICNIIDCNNKKIDFTRTHDNFYSYANLFQSSGFIWTLGLSYDDYDNGTISQGESPQQKLPGLRRNKFNPKLGLQWDMTHNIRFRAAAFKVFKRALAVNQTIEPTQIAGFNQFFDDINATTSTLYGLALDVRWIRNTYFGLEFIRRDIKEPSIIPVAVANPAERFNDRNENIHRAYFYWTPYTNLTINSEYRIEKFDRNTSLLRKTETHLLPLSLRYFTATGFFLKLSGTYVKQNISEIELSENTKKSDDFILIDSTIGYRLLQRKGIISLTAKNLLNKNFNYQDMNEWVSDTINPRFTTERSILGQLTLHF